MPFAAVLTFALLMTVHIVFVERQLVGTVLQAWNASRLIEVASTYIRLNSKVSVYKPQF